MNIPFSQLLFQPVPVLFTKTAYIYYNNVNNIIFMIIHFIHRITTCVGGSS